MTADDWQGRLGRRNILVNSRTANEAAETALEASVNFFFKTERILGPDDDTPTSIAPSIEAERAAGPSGGGAWSVTVLRLGHATSSGSESASDYFVQSIEFLGARPHDLPHASREPGHWLSIALAIDETAVLSISAALSTQTPPKRRTPL